MDSGGDSMQGRTPPDDEDVEADALGFLFGGALPRRLQKIQFGGQVSVQIMVADDGEPGAVQSGHYLWPAAELLAAFVVSSWEALERPQTILELGAGVGLVGLAAAQLPGCQTVLLTDHDPGVVERLKLAAKENAAASLTSTVVAVALLSWGPVSAEVRRSLSDALTRPVVGNCGGEENGANGAKGRGATSLGSDTRFQLVVASDVIYTIAVVQPLFATLEGLMERNDGARFLMCQSFAYDAQVELEIYSCCTKSGLRRVVLVDTLEAESAEGSESSGGSGGYRLQEFRWAECALQRSGDAVDTVKEQAAGCPYDVT